MPHGTPDVIEVVERIATGGTPGSGHFRKQTTGLRRKLPREAGGDLHVSSETGVLRDGRQPFPRIRGIAHGVITVRGIEKIDVTAAGIVAVVDDLLHFREPGRSHRAAGAANL